MKALALAFMSGAFIGFSLAASLALFALLLHLARRPTLEEDQDQALALADNATLAEMERRWDA